MAISTVETYSILGDIAPTGATIDKQRRLFNFGERIAEIEPMQSAFFSYISKLRKVPTDDPTFKFLEQRHQWQRRNFYCNTADAVTPSSDCTLTGFKVSCLYDEYGRVTTANGPNFFIVGQRIAFKGTQDSDGSEVIFVGSLTAATVAATYTTISVEITSTQIGTTIAHASSGTISTVGACTIAAGAEGQVIGSAFAEGTGAPLGWRDELYDRDGYTQIFKTAIPLFSGTSRATRYRGRPNEYLRVWQEKLKEHKADLTNAMLFGVGKAGSGTSTTPSYTWGITPYVEAYGKRYSMYYGSSNYDNFMDNLEDFFAPESGNSYDKLVLTSRKVLNWLNKLGDSGFLKNTVSSSSYRFDVQNIKGKFGHNVTKVETIFGNLHFIQEPMLRGWMEDYAVAVDLKNVAYRPLKGNGISRDTFITTNVQDNDIDGRKDIITTEAGLEINLPETHAVFKWA